MRRLANYINGESVAPKSGRYVELISPVTGQPFAEMPVSNADDMDAAHETRRIGKIVDQPHADARHAEHVEHHDAVVGQFDPCGECLEWRTGRRHQIRDHVHRLP